MRARLRSARLLVLYLVAEGYPSCVSEVGSDDMIVGSELCVVVEIVSEGIRPLQKEYGMYSE